MCVILGLLAGYIETPFSLVFVHVFVQGKRYINAVGFLEDLCLGNISGDGVHHDEDGGSGESEESVVLPNLHTFNLVLATLAMGGKWKKALDVSAPLRSEGRSVGGGMEDSSRGCGRGGKRGEVRGQGGRGGVVSAGMAASDAVSAVAAELTADGETYTHLIVACGKGGEPDRYGGLTRKFTMIFRRMESGLRLIQAALVWRG